MFIPGPVAPGQSTTVDVDFLVNQDFAGIVTNGAEITSAQDMQGNAPLDIDSRPDGNSSNDPEVNDEINDNGTIDEDDADIESLNIEVFDLALRKTLAQGEDARVYPGETITFTIEVFNQGTVTAQNIAIADYVPTGLTATGATNVIIPGPIAPGQSGTVAVSYTHLTLPTTPYV